MQKNEYYEIDGMRERLQQIVSQVRDSCDFISAGINPINDALVKKTASA